MAQPIIGITARRWLHAAEADRLQTRSVGVHEDYVASVQAAGGAALLLARTDDAEAVAAMMERIDGLLLPGGGDILSAEYREAPHPATKYPDAAVDRLELEAGRVALERGMPVLGICRGIQVLAVLRGGSLVQDIPSQTPGAIGHWIRPRAPALVHAIDIEPGSLLARVLGTERTSVNSYHHQSVKNPGEGLRVTARSSDGVVEAIEAADGGPVLAVQCHPEELTRDYPLFRKLFEWLVREAGAWRTATRGPAAS